MQKITINIEVNWGSDFQREFFIDCLEVMLKTWMNFAHSKHKQNKISYEVDFNDGYKIKQV